jgi:hypothetical protein
VPRAKATSRRSSSSENSRTVRGTAISILVDQHGAVIDGYRRCDRSVARLRSPHNLLGDQLTQPDDGGHGASGAPLSKLNTLDWRSGTGGDIAHGGSLAN